MKKRTIKVKHHLNIKRQPVMTTCSIREPNGDQAIGIALCSKKDRFNGKVGKKIAIGRAFYALSNQTKCRKINRIEALDILAEVLLSPLTHKCEFIPA